MVKQAIWILFIYIIISGCTREPKSDVATISHAEKAETLNDGKLYVIDTGKSLITWVGTKPTGRHNGIIRLKEGDISILEEKDKKKKLKKIINITKVNAIIDMNTVDVVDLTDNPTQYRKLKNHLHSEDFFNTSEFPEAEFNLISLIPFAKDSLFREDNGYTIMNPTHSVKGNLTIKDTTLAIQFPAKIDLRNSRLVVSAKFNIDRTNWNINYLNENDPVARAKDGFIHNIVHVSVDIIARPKKN